MKKQITTLGWLVFSAPLLFASALMADDAEIYYSQSASANPNILFLLDNSGSMESNTVPDSGGKTRMQVMQEAFSTVMANAPPNLNVGLMRYGGHGYQTANGVSFPAKPIDIADDGTGDALSVLLSGGVALNTDNLPDPVAGTPVRQFLADVGNSWTAKGYTPIVDALYEAASYYRGDKVDFGDLPANDVRAAHPSTYKVDGAMNCSTSACNNSAGECSGTIVAGSCATQTETVCTQYQDQSTDVTLSNQCCVWETVQQSGECCGWIAAGYDEAGNATGWICKDNDFSCTKDVQQCKDNNYSCTTTQTQTNTVCVNEEQQQVERCQQQICTAGKRYISPIQYECQSNYIVLMSDGHPQYSGSNANDSYPLRKGAVQTLTSTGPNCDNDSPSGYKSGTCGPELTKFLATHDQSSAVDGDQFVNTFTVAFGVDDTTATEYLASLANVSNGALAARDEEGLKLAFEQILHKVNGQNPASRLASATPAYHLHDPSVMKAVAKNDGQDMFRQTFGLLGDGIKYVEVRALLLDLLNPLKGWGQLAAANSGAFTAGSLQDLTDVFNSILGKINASASSFSSPAYNVDKNSLLSHDDEVYIPVFEHSTLPLWEGNLKKFKLKDGQIVGKDDQPAVDEQGAFTAAAWDLWSDAASGKDVTGGGAANKLPLPALRKLYTDASGLALSALDVTNTAIPVSDLYQDDDHDVGHGNNPHQCDPDNPDASLWPACILYRTQLIEFMRGIGIDGRPRNHMGDVMNNKPIVVDYSSKGYVLAGTNEGFLHAFDAETGVEKWAFMPVSLLQNAAIFYDNTLAKQHVYGIDGQFTTWFTDVNGNGRVDKADGDHFYLYFGMRRGGRGYYALDLSDIDSPKVLWKIDNTSSGFAELGESWSKPALAKMRFASGLKEVLVFGAGFDPALEEEDPAARQADSMGRDVFIVDAETGELLWSLRQQVSGVTARLTHSIPGDIRVLDMDRNGALDRLYFADTGGKVWRVDMDMDVRDTDAGFYNYADAQLSLFADLAGTGTDSRKFFYEPDIALMQNQGQTIMTLAIGSGYRSHPQSKEIQDRFYVLLDPYVYAPPPATTSPLLQDSDLTEADALANNGQTLLDGVSGGWYYDLPNTGEKVLASALTFMNKVIFTTFANDGEATDDPCAVPPNTARAYVLDLLNGQAVADLDRSGDGVKDKSVIAGVNEILGSAQLIFRAPTAADGSDCTAADCGQSVEIRVGKMNMPLMDAGNSDNTSANVAEHTDLGDLLPRIFWLDQDVSAQ